MTRARRWSIVVTICALAALGIPHVAASDAPATALDQGFRELYNLDFDAAHQAFQQWQRAHPEDPLGHVSDAAAYLFSEFDRLHVLEVELFVDDNKYEHRVRNTADPKAKQGFDQEINKAQQLVDTALARNPRDANALFSKVLMLGLEGDYAALIEKRDLRGLSYMKQGRAVAQQLLAVNPHNYDAYLAIGVENYLLSLKPAPVRWILQIGGAETDKETGLDKLEITAEKGHYLLPYARMLLAVAALRDHDRNRARGLLQDLAQQYPQNHLYAQELARLR